MIILLDILAALIITLLACGLLVLLLGWRRPGYETQAATSSLLFLFIILFLPIWALGSWMTPFGPMVHGAYWGPFALMGFLFALLILTLAPVRDHSENTLDEDAMGKQARDAAAAGWGASVFWAFLGVSLLLAILSYHLPES